jgi:hypothetical protein
MTIRTDVSIDWESSPRVITVAAPSDEITIQDLVDTCRYNEELLHNIDSAHLIDAAGKEFLGGTTYVGITATLQNAVLAFEARSGPSWELCIISGGNLVAVDEDGLSIDPRLPTAYTSVDRTASASATLQEQAALQHSSFEGGVTVDFTSTHSGTEYPVGTSMAPVNNWSDAMDIAVANGLTTFFILGDATLTSGVDFSGFHFVGSSISKTTLTLDAAATVDDCEYYDATIQGTLDGSSTLKECRVLDIDYVQGTMDRCILDGSTILLLGDAAFMDCYSGNPDQGIPEINLNGSGKTLALRNYNGKIRLSNKSGSEEVGVDLNSGVVYLDSDVTAGTINIRGVGTVVDNSVGATVNTDELINPEVVADQVWDENLITHVTPGSAATALRGTTYLGVVVLDTVNGSSGVAWPIGTTYSPSDNLADALSIMNYGNVETLVLRTGITVGATQDISNKIIKTEGKMGTDVVLDAGCTAHKTTFRNVNISGEFSGSCQTLIENCSVDSLKNFLGIMNVVAFNEGAEISFGSWATILDGTGGGEPTNEVEFSIGDSALNVVNWNGNLKLKDKTGSSRTVINCNSGNIIIDSTCIAGKIQLIGVGTVEADNSGVGCDVDTSAFLDASVILNELEFIMDIEGGRWRIVANQMVFYKEDNTTEVARFNLFDSGGSPTMTNVFERQRV